MKRIRLFMLAVCLALITSSLCPSKIASADIDWSLVSDDDMLALRVSGELSQYYGKYGADLTKRIQTFMATKFDTDDDLNWSSLTNEELAFLKEHKMIVYGFFQENGPALQRLYRYEAEGRPWYSLSAVSECRLSASTPRRR